MRSLRAALAAACAIALVSTSASAQQPAATLKLDVGQWTGQVVTPNGEVSDLTYDVTARNDSLAITINAGQYGIFAADGIKLEATKLSFNFTPGPRVACALDKKDDGSYSGTCTDEGGGVAQLTMLPPKKPAGT